MDDTNKNRTARARPSGGALRTQELWALWTSIASWSESRCESEYWIAVVAYERLSGGQREAVERGVRRACAEAIAARPEPGDWQPAYDRRSRGIVRHGQSTYGTKVGYSISPLDAEEGLRELEALCDDSICGKKVEADA